MDLERQTSHLPLSSGVPSSKYNIYSGVTEETRKIKSESGLGGRVLEKRIGLYEVKTKKK